MFFSFFLFFFFSEIILRSPRCFQPLSAVLLLLLLLLLPLPLLLCAELLCCLRFRHLHSFPYAQFHNLLIINEIITLFFISITLDAAAAAVATCRQQISTISTIFPRWKFSDDFSDGVLMLFLAGFFSLFLKIHWSLRCTMVNLECFFFFFF